MTANQERPAGDGQTGPLHELCAARVPWPWVHNSSPFDRLQATNHTIICPTAPFAVVPKPAPDRTRGEDGGVLPCLLGGLLDGMLATTRRWGALRSPSHWPLGLVGSVKNPWKSSDATKRVSGPRRRNWRSRSGVALPGPLAFHRGSTPPSSTATRACKLGAQGRTATCNLQRAGGFW
jgi:hypothetical protein